LIYKKLSEFIIFITLCSDSIGKKWTIGWGNTIWENGTPVKSGDTITDARALALLKFWVDKTGADVQNFLGSTSVNQNQFDALVSFAFNVRDWKGKNSGLMNMVKANPKNPEIRNQFMKYTNGGVAGLVRRRQAEADLYFKK
jgi:lysozyme